MHEKEMAAYAHWLHSVPGVGSRTFMRLLHTVGMPDVIYKECETIAKDPVLGLSKKQADSLRRHRREIAPEEAFAHLSEQQIEFVWVGEDAYPARLRDIPDAPAALYYKGRLPAEQTVYVSVVGARECTTYGQYIAEELGKQLSNCGAIVVSGMARGIDGICQKEALESGGTSVAVLGCGVDICYPARNREIYNRLIQSGAVVSEYVPGTEPSPALFPARNRIISGLSDCLVVVEARAKSGTLITVDMALEQGKDVYVVPGRVTDSLSVGCNALIKQGAGVLTSVEEFVADVCGRNEDESVQGSNSEGEELSPSAQRILNLLDSHPRTADELFECVSKDGTVSLQELLTILLELCMEGRVEQIGGSYARTFR